MFAKVFTAATLLTAASAGCVRPSSTSSAAPSGPTGIPANGKFGIMALRSASPIHFASTSAEGSHLYLNAPETGAVCTGDNGGSAVFYLKDGGLYLYTTDGAPAQQMWVDRSGMGQGITGYSTGGQGVPRNGETTGFAIDSNNSLSFNGVGFLACPGAPNGGWSIWVDAGISQPGGHEGCLGFSARAVEESSPFPCEYSQQ
ncbi:uncharacterized protein B0I36DRAFT_332294 [Microdochium trichocladiopsis]|uniref:Cell wall protein PhiA n=1 Tax=Microdochium trichocladiopsis TaxID=1682393 RepID=A0A9P8Y0F3_9PEZI|nr:uncharacterized protein B0I36DRAFT_332294 [Microdochium trichocladiopsis]KAH7024958.1 hypothetical protein B0I36DRAFT_332294 [Microdochium trichocladiopsis]